LKAAFIGTESANLTLKKTRKKIPDITAAMSGQEHEN
jgi:hypothetical protein